MKLTTKGRYAVMAMADLATYQNGKPVSLVDISLRQNISLSYLEQLFSKLKNEKNFAIPSEGHLIQVVKNGIIGGEKYDLTFWIKEIDFGVSYVQQYMINWISDTGEVGDIAFTNFKG